MGKVPLYRCIDVKKHSQMIHSWLQGLLAKTHTALGSYGRAMPRSIGPP